MKALLICVWFGIFLAGIGGFGSHAVRAQAAFQFDKPAKSRKLKFELHRNMIIVQLKLNGKGPFKFLLDTGINHSLITEAGISDSLSLQKGAAVAVAGMGEGGNLEAYFSPNITVGFPGVKAEKLTFVVLSEDVLQLGKYIGEPVHGILGYDFFCSFTVVCNFNTLTLTLYPEGNFKPEKSWQMLSLTLEENKPYVSLPVSFGGAFLPLKLLVDTGAGHALSLEAASEPNIKVPERNMPTQLGTGLSGPVHGVIARLPKVKIGHLTVQNLLASFPDSASGSARLTTKRNGNLGMELLKRFQVAFDYQSKKMYLKKHDSLTRPFEYDMCGLEITALPPKYHTYVVAKVHENSPAAAAGILPNDELLALDLLPATSYTLTQIGRLFHSRHGREINMLLKRDGQLLNVTVKLKRRI